MPIPLLRVVAARPLPAGPWIMSQTWHDLLFAHWPLDPAVLRPLVPPGLEIDTFAGQAWLGLVAFRLSGVRLRGLPALPFVSAFPEVNVRTYVRRGTDRGVLFLSLDANARLGMALARPWFRLAYVYADMGWAQRGEAVYFASRRPDGPGFVADYGPTAPVVPAAPGTLPAWLTERYCYYSADRQGRLYRCAIAHAPWPLQAATATIAENTLPAAHGLTLPAVLPLLHYARYMQARIWPVRGVAEAAPHGWGWGPQVAPGL